MDLEILLNKSCQLKCEYCSLYGKDYDLDLNSRLNDLSKIKDNIKNVFILGGEPTLSKYIIDILKIFKNINVTIFTNLININKLIDLKQYHNKLNFICSYHRQVNFHIFLSNLLELSKFYDKQNIQVNIMKSFKSDIFEDYYNKIKLLKFNVSLDPVFYIKDGVQHYEDINIIDLKKYNSILNNKNNYLNKTFYELYDLRTNPKKCDIQNKHLFYNFIKGKFNRCFAYDMLNLDSDLSDNKICNVNCCLCYLEFVYEF